MDSVGIITIPDYNNYGNRLQNYAVKTIFEKRGYRVYTLEMNDSAFEKYEQRKYKLWLRKYKIRPLIFFYEVLKCGITKARRERLFEKFSVQYLNIKYEPIYNKRVVNNLLKEISFFVLGSDQIWHPYINDTPNLYFAKFVPPKRRIYFSPSFGVEELSNKYQQIVFDGLNDAIDISVREPAGQRIIEQILGKKATILIDPTLMLDAEDWKKVAKKPHNLWDEDYLLKCFLGPINREYGDVIKNIESETGLKTYTLANKEYTPGYVTGPSEFVYSIMNSKLVLTDSFHAVVFSILLNKPFVVFSRLKDNGENAGLDSRVDELLTKMKLESRKYVGDFNISLFECDFEYVQEVLDRERTLVEQFLDKNIEIAMNGREQGEDNYERYN